MPIKLNILRTAEIEAATIHLYVKARDSGTYRLKDGSGGVLAELDGYVPNDIIPGEFGDYIDLEIDLESGRVVNWKAPTAKAIRAAFFVDQEG